MIGAAEVISSISRRAIASYHRGAYVAGNIVLAAAGNLEHDRVLELLDRASRHARRDSGESDQGADTRSCGRPSRGLRFQRKDTEQFHVCVGAPGIARSDRRRFAASLLDSILGGSASSRLFQEIREKRGMAYSVYSFASQYTDTGLVGIYVGTREENLAACLEVVAAAGRRHRRRRLPRTRARAGEGEPEGPDRAVDGVDLEPDEPARPLADHRHRAALARPDHRRDRRGRARRRRPSSRACSSSRTGSRRPGSGRARTASSRRVERIHPGLAAAA